MLALLFATAAASTPQLDRPDEREPGRHVPLREGPMVV